MALFRKPHSVTRYKATENVNASTLQVRGTYYDNPVELTGQLTPEKSGVHFNPDTGNELDRPHMFMWDTDDDCEVGDLFKFGTRYFKASLPQQIWDAEPMTAHRLIVVEELLPGPVESANEDL